MKGLLSHVCGVVRFWELCGRFWYREGEQEWYVIRVSKVVLEIRAKTFEKSMLTNFVETK